MLFVEDDAMNRRVVKDTLRIVGADAVGAENAEAGLAAIDSNTFIIVLMDLRTPGMDGMSAVNHIRARTDAEAQLLIIVVTEDTATDLRESCMSGEADDVVRKPVTINSSSAAWVMSWSRQRSARKRLNCEQTGCLRPAARIARLETIRRAEQRDDVIAFGPSGRRS